MPPRFGFRYEREKTVGPWMLLDPLGSGGNGEVWKARSRTSIAAIKICRSRTPTSEPYRRFADEVLVLKSMGDRPGIVRLTDSGVPAPPTRQAPAWFAMPEAVPIGEHLRRTRGLDAVVN